MSQTWLFGVLALGATGRLTRLVTADTITAGLRARAVRAMPGHRGNVFAEFITCPWCVSIWIAPAVIAIGWWPANHGTASWWWFPAALLTCAWATGLLTSALDN